MSMLLKYNTKTLIQFVVLLIYLGQDKKCAEWRYAMAYIELDLNQSEVAIKLSSCIKRIYY